MYQSVAGGGRKYICTPIDLLLPNNPGLVQAAFFQFEIVDERNCGVFIVEDVKVVVGGDSSEGLLLVLGRAFDRGVGLPALEDAGEALAKPLELLRAHDPASLLGRPGRRRGDLVACNRVGAEK